MIALGLVCACRWDVVLGADGLATTDMLRMKAVSLSFKD